MKSLQGGKKMKKKKLTIILSVLMIVLLCVFVYSGYKIYSTMHSYSVAKKEYDSMSNQYTQTLERTEIKKEDEEKPEEKPVEVSPIVVDFDALSVNSSDIVGWIYSEGTVINYPVVKGVDNDFYLSHFMDGSWNPNGTIFLDFAGERDFSCRNNIIYGHNMNDGSMFRSITGYSGQEYYEQHPVMYLNTPTQDYKLEIFSAYITPFDSYTYTYAFENEDVYAAYLNQVQLWSLIDTPVTVTDSDRIVTLSTCTYEFENARFVVQAKMTPIGYDKTETPAS